MGKTRRVAHLPLVKWTASNDPLLRFVGAAASRSTLSPSQNNRDWRVIVKMHIDHGDH
jgi:hypothetical protein